jgi:hypothetical protein
MYSITADKKDRFYPQNIKVKIAPLPLRNFPKSLTPPFFAPHYLSGKKSSQKRHKKPRHPAPGCAKNRGELRLISPPKAAQPTR